MSMNKLKVFSAISVAFILAACSSRSTDSNMYYWGDYSDVVYSYYNEPNDFAKQENTLREIINVAKEKNKAVAPGVYAHLGLALLKQGKGAEAQAAFQQEQMLFPESKAFIQYLQRKK